MSKPRDIAGWLRTLDLEPGASAEQIKTAWRDLAQVWHPDRFGSNERLRRKAEESLKRINEAYVGLSAATTSTSSRKPEPVYQPETHQPGEARLEPRMVLAEGVLAWNFWRKKYSDIVPRLVHAQLARKSLAEVDFRECVMDRANLQEADLYKANLSYASFQRARFCGADLNRSLLLETDFSGADLSGTNLCAADMRGANLTQAKLMDADLVGARLEGANLRGAIGLSRQQIALVSVDNATQLPEGV